MKAEEEGDHWKGVGVVIEGKRANMLKAHYYMDAQEWYHATP
jgi:hypothetical protein